MGLQTDLELFKQRAEAVQAVVLEIDELSAAFDYAIELTTKQGGKSIGAFGWESGQADALEKALEGTGLALLRDNLRQHAADLHTALTPADWGIAATGSLVLISDSEELRLATMLSETHIAVLPLSRLRRDSEALEADLTNLLAAPPGYVAFITGASRTADIERVLTIGVHGPEEVHVLILRDLKS